MAPIVEPPSSRPSRDFILRGNVIDLAVAVVMGLAFGAVVNSVVKNLVTPLITLVGGAPDKQLSPYLIVYPVMFPLSRVRSTN
jgi:large conductance mechanosensitive channel protein